MPTQLTEKWDEAMKLTTECKVVSFRLIRPNQLAMHFVDPAGQGFDLVITARASPGLQGNILTLNPDFSIIAFEHAEVFH